MKSIFVTVVAGFVIGFSVAMLIVNSSDCFEDKCKIEREGTK